jgi:hypothetical protein
LAGRLPELLSSTNAPTALKGYHAEFKKWKDWAGKFEEVLYFPANDTHVALYLVNLIQCGLSFSTIQSAFYGISFFHRSCGVSNPCDFLF